MIRGVVFDCFGVLAQGYLDYLRSIVPPARMQELNDLSHAADRGMVTRAEYVRQMGELLGKTSGEVEALARERIVRSDEMTALVRSLRPRYKVALLSNIGPGMMDELFSAEEQAELFDTVVLSSEVGVTKPGREAFELTARRLGLRPDECVMIDDLPRNIEGAEVAGMKGLLCENPAQCAAGLKELLQVSDA